MPDFRYAPASRDTDADIARLIFGWRWMLCPERGRVALYPPAGPEACWHIHQHARDVTERFRDFPRFEDWDRMGDWRGHSRLPSFTEDVALALGLLWDALIEDGWQMSLVSRPYADAEERWIVNGVRLLDPTVGRIQRLSVRAPDRCLAVSRFALAQTEGEQPVLRLVDGASLR